MLNKLYYATFSEKELQAHLDNWRTERSCRVGTPPWIEGMCEWKPQPSFKDSWGVSFRPDTLAHDGINVYVFELKYARKYEPLALPETEQIDGAVYVDGIFAIVEAKDHAKDARGGGRVKFEPIAKMRSQLLRRPGVTIGMMFSTNGFTDPAKILARFLAPQTILLWDGDDLAFALSGGKMRHGVQRKLRHAVEQGLPDYQLSEREGDR